MIDFHCHLDLYPDPSNVIRRINQAGMYVLAVTTTPKAWHGTRLLVGSNKRIRVALGLHPELVSQRHMEIDLFERLLPETDYIGEVGLDGSPPHRESISLQTSIFDRILHACARAGGRIISVHSRGATRQVIDILEHNADAGTAVLHWFAGSKREAKIAADIGCFFSVGPAMLKSKKAQDLLGYLPKNLILTETDGPLASVSDKPLMPWEVAQTLTLLAFHWRTTQDEASNIVTSNFSAILQRRAKQPQHP